MDDYKKRLDAASNLFLASLDKKIIYTDKWSEAIDGSFSADENYLASIIGHEAVHRSQSFAIRRKAWLSANKLKAGIGNGYDWAVAEKPAYEWELNNTSRTGLTSTRDIELKLNEIYNILNTWSKELLIKRKK